MSDVKDLAAAREKRKKAKSGKTGTTADGGTPDAGGETMKSDSPCVTGGESAHDRHVRQEKERLKRAQQIANQVKKPRNPR